MLIKVLVTAQVPNDTNRLKLFRMMLNGNYTSNAIANATSTYFDSIYTPAAPIYCTRFPDTTA